MSTMVKTITTIQHDLIFQIAGHISTENKLEQLTTRSKM